jgi:purine-binding chemotaxis protein CheW
MSEPGQFAASNGQCRFLTFRREATLYALPAEEVLEVIRVPAVARVPQGPNSLLGMANLRGSVVPVASLDGLLGLSRRGATPDARAIVLSGLSPVALVVEAVDALVAIDATEIETVQMVMAAEPGEHLRGAFRTGADRVVVKILDIKALLAVAFAQRARPAAPGRSGGVRHEISTEAAEFSKLVTFDVAGQEFALNLQAVREIIPVPEGLTLVPRSEALVLGVTSYRDTLLPLFSLRGLLGFPPASAADDRRKIVVTTVGGALVGLVADRMRAIVPADPALIEPTPLVLTARVGGEARIRGIYRGEAGKRLISILAPEVLFREETMQRLGQAVGGTGDSIEQRVAGETQTFLVFRLGDDEFGLPIDAVDEVAEVPAQITRVPKTPDFLEGVINQRGHVLPVVDQRRRFAMPQLDDGSRRRLVVVRTANHRAGLIVDSVSKVLRSDTDAISDAPDLTGEATRLVTGIINQVGDARMVLILDPAELLTRVERALLDVFQADTTQADL